MIFLKIWEYNCVMERKWWWTGVWWKWWEDRTPASVPAVEKLFCILATVLWNEVQPNRVGRKVVYFPFCSIWLSEDGANIPPPGWLASYFLVFDFPNVSFVWSVLFGIWEGFYEMWITSCHFVPEFFWWIWIIWEWWPFERYFPVWKN